MRKERLCENVSVISRHNRMSAVIKQMVSVIWVTKSMSSLISDSVHMNVLKIFLYHFYMQNEFNKINNLGIQLQLLLVSVNRFIVSQIFKWYFSSL